MHATVCDSPIIRLIKEQGAHVQNNLSRFIAKVNFLKRNYGTIQQL